MILGKNKINNLKINKYKHQITICGNDAGAAYHLLEIFKKNQKNSKLCLDGPALEIFKRNYKNINNFNFEDCLFESKYLISGTGWSSNLEHNLRKLAFEKGLFNIAIIDHWVNYFERFKRGKEVILPNEIWVTDIYAFKKAEEVFPEISIKKIPNVWLENIKSQVIREKRKYTILPKTLPSKLLYLTEPVRSKWGGVEQGEFQSLRYFLLNLEKLSQINLICSFDKIKEITIKLHPSEESSKYDNLINEFNEKVPIQITKHNDLSDVLIESEACFGCETQALVVSSACGLPTFSSMPPWAPSCRLPQSEIIHLRNVI